MFAFYYNVRKLDVGEIYCVYVQRLNSMRYRSISSGNSLENSIGLEIKSSS